LPEEEDNFITVLSAAHEVVIEHAAEETNPIEIITNANVRTKFTQPLFKSIIIL
jgi:hypothetical protein